jgi:proline iminopeptidase
MRTLLSVIVFPLIAGVFAACEPGPHRSEVAEGYVTAEDGVRLFYRSVGEGSDVLVMPVALYLQDALLQLGVGRRVIFYDPRNRGRSDAADLGSISLDRQVADLEVLRKELGIGRMALLGWSGLGMEMAVYTIRYPQHVSRLIQVSAVPPAAAIMEEFGDARQSSVDQDAIDELNRRADEGVFDGRPEEFCRRYNELTLPVNFVNPELVDRVPDVCVHRNEWPENLWPYFGALLPSFGDYDWREDLKSLHVPRLIIHGREDGIPLAGAYAWAKGYPEARLLVLSPSGHFPFIEQPAEFFAAVERFLDGDWPASAMLVPEQRE